MFIKSDKWCGKCSSLIVDFLVCFTVKSYLKYTVLNNPSSLLSRVMLLTNTAACPFLGVRLIPGFGFRSSLVKIFRQLFLPMTLLLSQVFCSCSLPHLSGPFIAWICSSLILINCSYYNTSYLSHSRYANSQLHLPSYF